jgi:xylose isomerase
MAGSVHPVQTVELLVALNRAGYAGIIYFDTFPDHSGLNPVDEARANIRLTDRLVDVAARLAGDPALAAAQARQDGAAVTLIVMGALLGG